MKKLCIVNYITLNTWHPHGQARLKESLVRAGFEGDVLLFNQNNLKAPSHWEVPYAFKFYALMEARKRGYKQLLWVDASFWAIRNMNGLLELICKKKVLTQNSGCSLGQWTSDNCLKKFEIDRERAFNLNMFSGGFVGYDLSDGKAKAFFEEFCFYAKEGSLFKGAWTNKDKLVSKDNHVKGHRHDMSVGSILLQKTGISILPDNSVFSYYAWYQKYKTEKDLSKIYFVCEGGTRELPLKGFLI